jgi:hypothetical protein
MKYLSFKKSAAETAGQAIAAGIEFGGFISKRQNCN